MSGEKKPLVGAIMSSSSSSSNKQNSFRQQPLCVNKWPYLPRYRRTAPLFTYTHIYELIVRRTSVRLYQATFFEIFNFEKDMDLTFQAPSRCLSWRGRRASLLSAKKARNSPKSGAHAFWKDRQWERGKRRVCVDYYTRRIELHCRQAYLTWCRLLR